MEISYLPATLFIMPFSPLNSVDTRLFLSSQEEKAAAMIVLRPTALFSFDAICEKSPFVMLSVIAPGYSLQFFYDAQVLFSRFGKYKSGCLSHDTTLTCFLLHFLF